MDEDAFDSIMDIENDFYTDGYNSGLSDGKQSGLIEGKLFGIEKGYEKALEMGRLQGRAIVWTGRISKEDHQGQKSPKESETEEALSLRDVFSHLKSLPDNGRLQKHVEALLNGTEGTSISTDNSDDAVAAFEEQFAKASAKAKIIATIVGEPINQAHDEKRGIEDADGLTARH